MVHQRSLTSLRANFDKIEVYIDSFNNYFDIVAISETWLDNDNVKSIYNLPGYDTFFVNSFNTRPPGPGGGSWQPAAVRTPRAGGVTLCCRFSTSNDRILRFVASFH